MTISKTRLETLLKKMSGRKIMVVGDIMLDEYLKGSVDRISPEAPIPVVNLFNDTRRDVRLGGAANVFNNIASMGNKNIFLCGVIGNDENGSMIKKRLTSLGITTSGLIVDKQRPTTVKTRIIAHSQQVMRLDREERAPVSALLRAKIIRAIKKQLRLLDAVIFSDYEKGVITRDLLEEALPLLSAKKNIIVAVDPKFSNFRHFKNVTIIVPNRKEASGFVRHEIVSNDDAYAAAQDILASLHCECVLIKLGEHGMLLVDRKGHAVQIKTAAEQVYDVTGAGDTVISTLVLARTAGATWEEAARIANVAAGLVIHYVGTSTVTARQLKSAILDNTFIET